MGSLINRFSNVEKLLTEITNSYISTEKIDTIFIHSLLTNKTDIDISELFPKWCELFKFKKNIKVFINDNKCFFENKKEEIINKNCFKIYIPYDKLHIYKQAEKLFNFLADNNIAHLSYIKKYISNDVIIIKLNKIEDANKLNLFIKNNKEGLINANPCCFSYNDLAFAIDRRIDYNILTSYMIFKYITDMKKHEILHTISIDSLKEFALSIYEDIFDNGSRLDEFINDISIIENEIKTEGLVYYKLDQLVSYKDTFNLITLALDPNYDFMKYMKHFELLHEEKYDYNQSLVVNELLENVFNKKETYYNLKDKERILQESIISTIKKYNMNQGHIALNKYITSGDAKLFTRDDHARSSMNYILTPNDSVNIIKSFLGELDINKYVDITMNINLNKIKRELLDRAIIETVKEKGIGHTKETLELLTKHQNINDLKKISKNNDARRNFYKFINLDEIETLIKQSLTNLPGSIVQEKYIDLYLQRIKKNLEGA